MNGLSVLDNTDLKLSYFKIIQSITRLGDLGHLHCIKRFLMHNSALHNLHHGSLHCGLFDIFSRTEQNNTM